MKLHRALFTRDALANLFLFGAGLAVIAILWVSVVLVVAARWFGGVFIACCVGFVVFDRSGRESETSGSEVVHPLPPADLDVSDSLPDREHGREHAAGEPKDEAAAAVEPPVVSAAMRDGSPAASSQGDAA